MKKLLKTICCLLALNYSGCNQKVSFTESDENEVIQIDHDYSEVEEFSLTRESIFDVDSANYYVYFYSSTCSHCQEIKNYMISKALERKDIYFVRGTNKDKITTDTKILTGAERAEDVWILGYPSLLLISNKKVTKNLAGNASIKYELD